MSDRPRSPLGAAVRITGAVLFGLWFPLFVDGTLRERFWIDIPPGHTFVLDSWIVAAAVSSLVATAMALLILRETRSVGSTDRILSLALSFLVLAVTAYLFEAASPQGGFQMEVVGPVIPVPWNLDRGLIRALGVLALGLPLAAGFLWHTIEVPMRNEDAAPSPSAGRRTLVSVGILLVTIAAFYVAWGHHFLKALQSGAYD